MSMSWHETPGFRRSPNISGDMDLYELENQAADPDGVIDNAMNRIHTWDGQVVADIGAGTGFYIERFHRRAAHVIAVEPEPALRLRLMQRVVDHGWQRTSVIGASAGALPLRDDSVDIIHARFAYFFGPGCEPGLVEARRVLRPGGTLFVVDNDLRNGTFGSWVRSAYGVTEGSVDTTERFWIDHGFEIERLTSCWRFENREDFERVVQLEFPPSDAAAFLADHTGPDVDYHILLIHKTYEG